MCTIFMGLGLGSNAQDLSSSPYSRFGIGDIMNRNVGRGQAMGGLGIGLQTGQHLNLVNPASLGTMDSLMFIFEVGGQNQLTRYTTTDLSKVSNNLTFSYLGLGFPVAKWWHASAGIMPYSGVGYKMSDIISDPVVGDVQTEFSGDGGVSQFFVSQAFSPVKYLSMGFTFSYLFGPINHNKALLFPSDSLYFSTVSRQTAVIGDIHMNYGIQGYIPLKNNYYLTLGGIFENQSRLQTESRKVVLSSGQGLVDTLYYNVNESDEVVLPMGWGAGLSFGQKNKFTVGLDYRIQNWSQAKFLGKTDGLANSQTFIAGFEYIPDYVSVTNYYKRMKYRAGIHYGNSYLQIHDTQLTDYGINFGVGLPVRADRGGRASSVNISAEIGKRGTVENNLIKEFYGMLTFQLTLRDMWFRKLRYD